MDKKDESTKKLVKNIGFLTISQFSTKILTFLLVPLYTSVLTTEEYGTYDFFTTTIGLLIPILTLHIVEGILRFSLDKDEDSKTVFSSGVGVIAKGILFLGAIVLVNYIGDFSKVLNKYLVFFVLMFISDISFQTLSYFARGVNKVLAISIAGVISTVTIIVGNILFLLEIRLGLKGYFIATILGNVTAVIFLTIYLRVWKYFSFKNIDKSVTRKMILYSAPLILNQISWWINNASDRYVVIAICGIAANGIYSIGYKIPNILNTFQSIFNSSWVLSTVEEYDKEDKNGFFSSTYSMYNSIMVIVCSLIILLTRVFAYFLYAKDFFDAWRYVPFLTIAIVFGAMSGYLGGIFSAVKDTKIISFTTLMGAIVNIVLNILLVYSIGPIGAAIATTISCWVIFEVRFLIAKNYIQLRVNTMKINLSYILLIIQSFAMIEMEGKMRYCIQGIVVLIVIILYRYDLQVLYSKIKSVC